MRTSAVILVSTMILATLSGVSFARAQDGVQGMRVVPPHSVIHGKTLGEWGLKWWEWAYATPAERNPVVDEVGHMCGVAQTGPVFFLAGTFGGPVTRECVVPAGKHIFVALLNTIAWSDPDFPSSCDEVREFAQQILTDPDVMQCALDGGPVPNLPEHRENLGLECSVFYVEPNNLFEAPAELAEPAYTDGYWLMIEPPEPGLHVVEWFVAVHQPGGSAFVQDIRYNLIVSDSVSEPLFRRGDANDDGTLDMSDALYTLDFLFLGGDRPGCLDAADTNDDGEVGMLDALETLSHIFLGGFPPPLPGSEDCGADSRLGPDALEDSECRYESC